MFHTPCAFEVTIYENVAAETWITLRIPPDTLIADKNGRKVMSINYDSPVPIPLNGFAVITRVGRDNSQGLQSFEYSIRAPSENWTQLNPAIGKAIVQLKIVGNPENTKQVCVKRMLLHVDPNVILSDKDKVLAI